MKKLTKTQERLADAQRACARLIEKREAAIRTLIRVQAQLVKAERAVARSERAVRQERKDTKAALAQAAKETRAFDGDLGQHLNV